jgi:hypothetical protein
MRYPGAARTAARRARREVDGRVRERFRDGDADAVRTGGTPLLPPVTEDIALNLIEIRTFGSQVIYERYRRVRDAPELGTQR